MSKVSWLIAACLALTALIVLAVVKMPWLEQRESLQLELSLDAATGNECRVIHMYWPRPGQADDAYNSQVAAYAAGSQVLSMRLPVERIRYVSILPLLSPGKVMLRQMTLRHAKGQVLKALQPNVFEQVRGGKVALQSSASGLEVTWAGTGTPPEFMVNMPYPLEHGKFRGRVTLVSLYLLMALMVVFVLSQAFFLLRGVLRRSDPHGAGHVVRAVLLFLAITSLMVSCKMFIVARIGYQMPVHDQWDGEVWTAYLPFVDGTLTWKTLFTAHNEHRIFLHRAWALCLLVLNGCWDPVTQQVCNAFLHAVVCLAAGLTLWVLSGKRWAYSIALLLLLVFVMPYNWENTRFGFQSQFYFAELFALASFAWMASRQSLTPGWWWGVTCAFVALFSVGGSVLAGLAMLALSVLQALRARSVKRDMALLGLAGLVLFMYGWILTERPDYHQELAPRTITEFLCAWAYSLAWPQMRMLWGIPLVWFPFVYLLAGYVRGAFGEREKLVRFLVMLGTWVLLVSAATALSRGAGGAGPSSRHTELLGLGLLANGMACVLLFEQRTNSWGSRVARAVGALWWPWIILGILSCSLPAIMIQREWGRTEQSMGTYNAFLTRHDYALTTTLTTYPNPLPVASALRNENFQTILPPGMYRTATPNAGAFPLAYGNRLAPMVMASTSQTGSLFLVGFLLAGTLMARRVLAKRAPETQGSSLHVEGNSRRLPPVPEGRGHPTSTLPRTACGSKRGAT